MLVAYNSDSGVSFNLADKIHSDGRVTPGAGFKYCDFDVGVDSAQAGLYDDSKFGLDEVFANAPPAPESYGDGPGSVWYSHCCCATDGELRAGVNPCGVVSSSGFGDGGYDAYMHTDKDGKVDLVAIMFFDC